MIHKIYHIYHLIHLTYIISIIYIIYFIQYIYYILFIYYVIYVFHEVKCSARDSIYIDNTQQPTKKRRSFFSDLRHLLENATKNRTHLPEAQFVYGALTLLRHTHGSTYKYIYDVQSSKAAEHLIGREMKTILRNINIVIYVRGNVLTNPKRATLTNTSRS